MTYEQVVSRINGALPAYFAENFDAFAKLYDPKKSILTDEEIEAVEKKTEQDRECFEVIRAVRDTVDADPELHKAASLLRYVMCDARKPWQNEIWRDDVLLIDGFKNEQVNLLFVTAQLAKTLLVKKPPDDLNQENINAYRGYTRQCFNQKGYWGVNEFSWNMLCAGGCMFMCGALKFCPEYFTKDFMALEKDGEYISLVCGCYGVNKYGELTRDGDAVFNTSFEETDEGFKAHRVAKDGTVQPELEFFSKSEYNVLLRGGSHTINFHIPTGMNFVPEVVKDAMRKAVKFYADFYPDHETKAISVYSWLFSPQMRLVMGEDSNILSVQRMSYLLPVTGTFDHTNRFIRQGSSLSERIKAKTEEGRKFHIGIAYFPLNEIED